MINVCIYWVTRNREHVRKIRERFAITAGQTINGETYTQIKESDWNDFSALLESGKYITLRNKPPMTNEQEKQE